MTRFLLLRHGESTWNAVRRWQGSSDPPLSELGEVQARGAGVLVAAHGSFVAVVTSSLQRARRTGELLAATAELTLGAAYPGLSERSAGEWEGLTRVEIDERFPGAIEAGGRPAGYEADGSVIARVLPVLDELAATYPGEDVVVVTHGGVIHVLERHSAGVDGPWQRLDNLQGRWFEHTVGGIDVVGERVSLLVDAHHTPALDEGYA